jgi:hypothetical protein
MTGLTTLWLPILLSAALVFLVSFVVHMVLPWHKGDYRAVPNEDQVRDALRRAAIPPGDYMIPRPSSRAEMRSPEFTAKLEQGPNVVMTIMPNGRMPMGTLLFQWFVYLLVVSLFAGYITSRALPVGAPYLAVFRFAGATAFIAHAFALWPMSIWYRRAWGTTVRSTIDGLLYGLLAAGVFGWLWPR